MSANSRALNSRTVLCNAAARAADDTLRSVLHILMKVEEPVKDKSKKGNQKVYYFVLVKVPKSTDHSSLAQNLNQVIYRIKLPGPAILGEGKLENQNHAIIFFSWRRFTENRYESALNMRNLLQEFLKKHDGVRHPSILGLREHIFTESVSSLAWLMSNQENSFVIIGQRLPENPLRVRFHYGHPAVFDRLFHLTRGGVSKVSKVIKLNEDIFAVSISTSVFFTFSWGRHIFMEGRYFMVVPSTSPQGEDLLSSTPNLLGINITYSHQLIHLVCRPIEVSSTTGEPY